MRWDSPRCSAASSDRGSYFLVQNYQSVKHDLIGTLFSGSGLVWYGGVIGGALAVVIWAWYRDFLDLALLDLTAPALALGYAVGRCGCQLSGDGDYGKPWNGPWAMAYPHGTVPTDRTVQPTPVYETLAMGLGAWILWQLRDRVRAGRPLRALPALRGYRAVPGRVPSPQHGGRVGLTAAQLESLAMMIVGAIWIYVAKRRHGSLGRPDVTLRKHSPRARRNLGPKPSAPWSMPPRRRSPRPDRAAARGRRGARRRCDRGQSRAALPRWRHTD